MREKPIRKIFYYFLSGKISLFSLNLNIFTNLICKLDIKFSNINFSTWLGKIFPQCSGTKGQPVPCVGCFCHPQDPALLCTIRDESVTTRKCCSVKPKIFSLPKYERNINSTNITKLSQNQRCDPTNKDKEQ